MSNLPRFQKIVFDTDPLVLFTVGYFDTRHLHKIKGKDYKKIDFDLLALYVKDSKIIVSPQILGEMCNIAENSLGHPLFKAYMRAVSSLLKEGIIEIHTKKEELLAFGSIQKFGFSDISVFAISDKHTPLLSGDYALYNLCLKQKKKAVYLETILSLKHDAVDL